MSQSLRRRKYSGRPATIVGGWGNGILLKLGRRLKGSMRFCWGWGGCGGADCV